jgi:hypothetical protein
MKVKYVWEKEELWLIPWEIYNVFSISLWFDSWEKYYIKAKWPKFIYPYDIKDFEIIDSWLYKNWSFGIDNAWIFVIWPKELYLYKNGNFWEDYYEDNKNCQSIVDYYYNIAKEELFN